MQSELESKIYSSKSKLSNFRDKDFRTGQLDAIKFCLESQRPVSVMQAPTGIGKSLIGICSGLTHGEVYYIVSSKALQDQIEQEFPEVAVLKGRSNYPCILCPGMTASECIVSHGVQCRLTNMCPYNKAKNKLISSKLKVINYDLALTEWNFSKNKILRSFAVLDEADVLEHHLLSFISLEITKDQLKQFDIEEPERKTGTAKNAIEIWKEWANEIYVKVNARIGGMFSRIKKFKTPYSVHEIALIVEMNKLISFKWKLDMFINNVDSTWIYEQNEYKGSWLFKPVWISKELANLFWWRHVNKWTLMSGTFPPMNVFAYEVGLNIGDIDYMELPSLFHEDNRPIHVRPVANITAKTKETEIPKLLNAIESILDIHSNEKGIIHAVNYSLCRAIVERFPDRCITHEGKNRSKVLEEFKNSEYPHVLVSPSMERGIDLRDDLGRFAVYGKAPYPDLSDKQTNARLYSGQLGNYWYKSVTAMSIVQGLGRCVRNENDHAVGYLLDEQIAKLISENPRMFPKYFRDALIWD